MFVFAQLLSSCGSQCLLHIVVHDCFPRVEAYKNVSLAISTLSVDEPNMCFYERSPCQWWEGREIDVKKRLNSTLVEEARPPTPWYCRVLVEVTGI